MSGRRGRALRFVAGGIVAAALTGCGVGAQQSPTPIDSGDVPFGLATPSPEVTPTTPAALPYSSTLYFVAGEHLLAVERGADSAPTPAAVLRTLVKGPAATESESGVRTLLDPSVTIADVTVGHGVATIDLDDELGTLRPGSDATLAIAQLVYTATALPGVSKVQLRVNGDDVELPRDDGTLTKQPVGRSDYPTSAP